jgi:hypothetical protein
MSSQDQSSTSEVSESFGPLLKTDPYHLDILLVGHMMRLHLTSLVVHS